MRCNMFHHEDTDLWEGRDRLLGKINWKRFWKRSISPQLSAKTEAEEFWPFEKKSGRLGKDHLGRKDRWLKRKRKTEKAMGKGHMGFFFEMSLIEVGRLAIDKNRFCYAVKDATPYGHILQLVRAIVKTFLQEQFITLSNKITVQGWIILFISFSKVSSRKLIEMMSLNNTYVRRRIRAIREHKGSDTLDHYELASRCLRVYKDLVCMHLSLVKKRITEEKNWLPF